MRRPFGQIPDERFRRLRLLALGQFVEQVDQRGQAILGREHVVCARRSPWVRQAGRGGSTLGSPLARSFQCPPVPLVQRRLDAPFRQPAQQAVLGEELVSVGGPRLVLPAAAEPVVVLPAELVMHRRGVQPCECVGELFPEAFRCRGAAFTRT